MSNAPTDCPFCLDNHKLKSDIVAETEAAFLIEASTAPGTYLIIPTDHVEALGDLPDTWWREVKQLLPHIPGSPKTYNVSINIGYVAGQRVPHLHFWVIPRAEGRPSSNKGMALLIKEADESTGNAG